MNYNSHKCLTVTRLNIKDLIIRPYIETERNYNSFTLLEIKNLGKLLFVIKV